MSRFLWIRVYSIKCLGFVLLFGLISLGAIGGCNNNGGGQDGTRAFTENDFVNDSNLSAKPDKDLVVLFLETQEAPEKDNLTGELGFDVIPYKYTRSINHTFCFEDSNNDSMHFMTLFDSNDQEVLRVEANGDCVTQVIEPGDYEMVLTHGEHVDLIEPVFLIPNLGDEQVAKRYRHNPSGFTRFFESINNFVTRTAIAQTDTEDNIDTLISTNACKDCDLAGVDLTGTDLTFSDLTGADLSGANMSGIELFESLLTGANLSGADLSNTDLRGAEMTGADLADADLSGSVLRQAVLSSADLTGADVTDADFSDADLINATWIDGSTCNFTSIGTCNSSSGDATPCDKLTLSSDNIIKCLLPTTDNSIDLADIFIQASSATSLNLDIDTPLAFLAWGGDGGVGSNGIPFGGGDGGKGGFASTVTTLSDFQDSFSQTSIYYYVAQGGTLSNVCGDGGSSSQVMVVESSPGSLDDMVIIAGGGGGGEDGGLFSSGGDGGQGGVAAASVIGQGFIGIGQSVSDGPDGGSTDGNGIGGSGDNDGKDGIGGEGGKGFLGANSTWLNGDPGVGSNGRGGNAASGILDDGCGGGGGGYGGGGAGDGDAGAGGGSWSLIPSITCSSAPNNDSTPSNPGTDRDSLGSKNGAVEVWIFADGC